MKNIFFSLTCKVEDKNALKPIRIRWEMTNNLWSQILVMLYFEYLLAILIFHLLNPPWTRIGHFAPLCSVEKWLKYVTTRSAGSAHYVISQLSQCRNEGTMGFINYGLHIDSDVKP